MSKAEETFSESVWGERHSSATSGEKTLATTLKTIIQAVDKVKSNIGLRFTLHRMKLTNTKLIQG